MMLTKERLFEVGLTSEEIEALGYMHFNTGDNTTEDDLSDEEILELIELIKTLKSKTNRSK